MVTHSYIKFIYLIKLYYVNYTLEISIMYGEKSTKLIQNWPPKSFQFEDLCNYTKTRQKKKKITTCLKGRADISREQWRKRSTREKAHLGLTLGCLGSRFWCLFIYFLSHFFIFWVDSSLFWAGSFIFGLIQGSSPIWSFLKVLRSVLELWKQFYTILKVN